MVIMMPPFLGNHLRFFQGIKHLAIQQLIPQASVKALIITVLPRTARLDVKCSDLEPFQPAFDGFGCKLTAIIAADMIGEATLYKQVGQHIHHIIGFQAVAHAQRQTFARIFINYGQNTDFTSVDKPLGHKVIAPHMVRPTGAQTDAGAIIQIKPSAFLLTLRYFQAFLAPDALNAFVINNPARSTQ